MGKTIRQMQDAVWASKGGQRLTGKYPPEFLDFFYKKSEELTGVNVSGLSPTDQFPAKKPLVKKLAPAGEKTTGQLDYQITGDMGVAAPAAPPMPAVAPGTGEAPPPKFTGLMRPIDPETGEPVPELGQRGLPPLPSEVDVERLDPVEVGTGPMGVRAPTEEPDFDPDAALKAIEAEGADAAFGDAELPDLPMDPEPPSAMEQAQDQVFGAIGDAAATGAEEFAKWVGRLSVRNIGRLAGIAASPYTLTKELVDGFTSARSAQLSFKMMRDVQELMNDPVIAKRLGPERLAEMANTVEQHRIKYEFNREEARKMQSSVLDSIKGMEQVLKDRMSYGAIPVALNWIPNAFADSKDMALGLGHLLFLDVLGFDGESQAVASMPDVDSFDSLMNYVGGLWDTGVGRGGDLIGGAAGAAIAIAGTAAPRSAWEGSDLGASVDWRSKVGGGLDAFEAAPVTTVMFLYGPMMRAAARFKGNLKKGTAAYRANYNHFKEKYGATSPEFAAWKRGEGAVPLELQRAITVAEKVRQAAGTVAGAGLDLGTRAVGGAFRTAGRAKAKAAFYGARAVPARMKGAHAMMVRWWADALHQLDENSAMWGNQVARGAQENSAAVLGMARYLSEEALAGRLYHQSKALPDADAPPPLVPFKQEQPFTMLDDAADAPLVDADAPDVAPGMIEPQLLDESPLAQADAAPSQLELDAIAGKGKGASAAEQELHRRHRLGIFPEEWSDFTEHVKHEFGMPFREAVGTEQNPGPYRELGKRLTTAYFNRKDGSRVRAALKTDLHAFSPEEKVRYGQAALRYYTTGDNLKKAEYKAYRDVLRERGIEGVSTDYRSMGLAVEQTPEMTPAGWVQGAGDQRRQYRVDADDPQAFVDENVRRADQEALDEETIAMLAEEGVENLDIDPLEEGWRSPADEADPRWTTPRVSDDMGGEAAFAEFNRYLNEQYPAARTTTGGMQRKTANADVQAIVKMVEEQTGKKTRMELIDETEQQVFAPDSGAEVLSKFPEEAQQRIKRAAEALGVAPEYFAVEFADALDWRDTTTFMKSAQIKRYLQDDMLRKIDDYNETAKQEGKQQISLIERDRLLGRLNKLSESIATGFGEYSRVFWKPDRFDKYKDRAFVYDIIDEARYAMAGIAKTKKGKPLVDMNEVLADTILATGFKTAEAVQRAKITRFARQQYAKAPVTPGETVALTLKQFMDGTRSAPSLLRRHPQTAITKLRDELKRTSRNEFEMGWEMSDGSTVLTKVNRLDIEESIRSLSRYKQVPDDVVDYLGLPEGEAVYAPKAFSNAVKIEIAHNDMITSASNLDRIVRSTKRGLVPLNVATTVRNFMSDWSLLALNEGNPMVVGRVVETGKLLHDFQTGKLRRADNPALYEKLEAIERTGLVDATFLEANFGHARFRGTFSIMTDALKTNDYHLLHRLARNLETVIEKKTAEPLLKMFRASTNAFKMYKAMQAYDQITTGAKMHRLGEVFSLEVRPNRWNDFEVVAMGKGSYLPGAKGYKHVATGRVLTKRQWQDVVARTSKVTSDKLFFDYNDAGAYLKVLRASPGLRITFGSLFGMYFAKSMTVPGVQRGLMLNVRNANPAMRVTNTRAAEVFDHRQSKADMHVQVASQGANAAMDRELEGRREILKEHGWQRKRAAFGVFRQGMAPGYLDFYDLSNLDFHESTEVASRVLLSGLYNTAEAVFDLPNEDNPGELLAVYGGNKDEAERLGINLESFTPDKRRYYESLRKLKMKELKGEGWSGVDVIQILSLDGGPILEGYMKIKRAEMNGRPLDLGAVVYDTAITGVGGTMAKGMSLVHAQFNPASKFSTFRYQVDDVEAVGRLGPSGSADKFLRWAITTALARTWKEVDMIPNAEKNARRDTERKWGLRHSLVTPFLEKAQAEITLTVAMPEDQKPAPGETFAEGERPERYKKYFERMDTIERMFTEAGKNDGLIQQMVGALKAKRGQQMRQAQKMNLGLSEKAKKGATRARGATQEDLDNEYRKKLGEEVEEMYINFEDWQRKNENATEAD